MPNAGRRCYIGDWSPWPPVHKVAVASRGASGLHPGASRALCHASLSLSPDAKLGKRTTLRQRARVLDKSFP